MLHNKSKKYANLRCRKLSVEEKAKLFTKIIQETFDYLNKHQEDFTIFLKFKKHYLEVKKSNLNFEESQYTFLNRIFGEEWLSSITGIKLSYSSVRHINNHNKWESQQSLLLGNKAFFEEELRPTMEEAAIEFIQLLPWRAQKKIFKAYHNFNIKQTVGSFRRLWRVLNYVVHVQFKLSYHWLEHWAELDIYTNEEFTYYKNELFRANREHTEPSRIHGLTLLKLSPPVQKEDKGIYGGVEDFFDLNAVSPINFDPPKKNFKIKKSVS